MKRNKIGVHVLTCLVIAIGVHALAFPTVLLAQARGTFRGDYLKDNPHFKKAFRKVIQQARKSTVEILDNGEKVALGTVVAADGYILTKASEMGENPVVKLGDGRELPAKVIARRKDHDLALLKVEGADLLPAQFRPSKEDSVGYWAVSVGTGKDPIALGVISVAMRKVRRRKSLLPEQSAYLGIHLASAEKGTSIERVLPKSGADKAGLQANDVILSIAGRMVTDAKSIHKVLSPYKPGDSVTLRIRRGEKEIEMRATLGKRPPSRGDIQNRMGSKLSERIDGFPVVLQHDSIVKPDECGGPLVDLDGKVIGINIARAGRTESYAIPSEIILPLVRDMRNAKNRVNKNNPGH